MKNYSRIRLTTNRYKYENLPRGSVGYIIETYDDKEYEVEFSDKDGITIAQIVLKESEIEPAELTEPDIRELQRNNISCRISV